MNATAHRSSISDRAYAVYYVYVPTVFHALIAGACLFFGPRFGANAWLLYIVAGLTLAAAFSGYLAYFEDRVSNFLALSSAMVNGALTIAIFAALHRTAGILCGSQVCSGTRLVEVSALARIAPPAVETSGCTTTGCVEIYTDLFTAIYFSTVTFTTLGYGDLQPVPDMRALAGFEAVVGYIFLGFLVGTAFHWGTNARQRDVVCTHCEALEAANTLRENVETLKAQMEAKDEELEVIKRSQERQQSQKIQSQEPDPRQG